MRAAPPTCLTHRAANARVAQVVHGYQESGRRLIVLGYNATLTTAVEAPRQPKRHFDQIKALSRVNPRIMHCLEVRARAQSAAVTAAALGLLCVSVSLCL